MILILMCDAGNAQDKLDALRKETTKQMGRMEAKVAGSSANDDKLAVKVRELEQLNDELESKARMAEMDLSTGLASCVLVVRLPAPYRPALLASAVSRKFRCGLQRTKRQRRRWKTMRSYRCVWENYELLPAGEQAASHHV